MTKRVHEEWDTFKEMVIDSEAPMIQKNSMKLAFYSGALSMMTMLFTLADEVTDPDVAEKIVEEWKKEFSITKDTLLANTDLWKAPPNGEGQ